MLTLILASFLTFVELNCENLFDCRHDSLKQDTEFMPESLRKWTPWRYWHKLNNIGKEIIACGEENGDFRIPDLVALTEVENDSVMHDLTRRSLLRNANYEYVLTDSPDERGIDVALLYSPFTFSLITTKYHRIEPVEGMSPTRDILYVKGKIISGDTLHVYVVHAPSKYDGEKRTRPYRLAVANVLNKSIDSLRTINKDARILIAGDFNETSAEPSITAISENDLHNVTSAAKGLNGAMGTYKYDGIWQSIDHVFVSNSLKNNVVWSKIFDAPFLLTEDKRHGGVKPSRTYNGMRYSQDGFSDHLPLVVKLQF